MKRIYTGLILAVCFLQMTCKNPLSNVQLYVRNSYYKYTVTFSIKDAKNPNISIKNAVITITGDDADKIFDKNGGTDFAVKDGMVDFSVASTVAPTTDHPITFIVNISTPTSSGSTQYIPEAKYVTIGPNQTVQRFNIRLIDANNPPDGIKIGERTIGMSSGGLSKPGYSGGRTSGSWSDDSLNLRDISIYIPDGTKFYYYKNGTKVAGTKTTFMTHDSTVTLGSQPIIYRPLTDYYTDEKALYPPGTGYTKTSYIPISTSLSYKIYYVYQDAIAPDYSIYPFGTVANTIKTLAHKTSTQPENKLLFKTAATKRLLAVYFVGSINDGGKTTYINISPEDTAKWFISYKINPTATNPNTGALYASNDSVESGINYTPLSSKSPYPLVPKGRFQAATGLSTIHKVIRSANGTLRAECQSIDIGTYQDAPYSTDFNLLFDATTDSNIVPDAENIYANATIAINAGSSTLYYNYQLFPVTSALDNFTLSGTMVGATLPTFTGSYYDVYYWDSLVKHKDILAGSAINLFAGPLSGPSYYGPDRYPDPVRFYYTFKCAATGTPKIVEPTFNSTFLGHVNYGGTLIPRKVNCNVVGGYWRTRGAYIGDRLDSLIIDACGKSVVFPPITLKAFNRDQIENDILCKCYFK